MLFIELEKSPKFNNKQKLALNKSALDNDKEGKMLQGFKDFISRGNVIDLAVGVAIGGAFSPVVSALTDKILMPLIAAIFGKPSFDNMLEFTLNGTVIRPGVLITASVNFLIVAAALYFFVVLPMNKFIAIRNNEPKSAETTEKQTKDIILLTEIRDLLAKTAQSTKKNLE